jgi:serine/threonine protein kinase
MSTFATFLQVLHGDLACRNILIAEDGTAKISDFGLSKNIYKTNVYKKQSDAPLPYKWLAPESIQDQIFTTQSDVWSYGITVIRHGHKIFTLDEVFSI